MSASVELGLVGKGPFRRTLKLCANGERISAALYPNSQRLGLSMPMLAWVSDKIADSRLVERQPDPYAVSRFNLWIGPAAFDVSTAEAKRIREVYEPLGLRCIEEAPFCATAKLSIPAAPAPELSRIAP